jgi:hypothetical protein
LSTAKENEEERFAGLSETVARVLEAILAVIVVMSAILTKYISPYYTISTATVLVITLAVFLTLKNKYSTERYKAKLQQQLELERHRLWTESNKPLLEQSSSAGTARMAKFSMCQTIIDVLQETVNNPLTPKRERETYSKIIGRIRDMQHAIMQVQ